MAGTYRALTRKYRPATFDDIVSQEHVSSTLKNAIEKDRLAHAYMFCGPRGVGKTTMARVLARTINQVSGDVDGEALGNTLNIIEIDAASNNKVEDVHRVRESVRIPPQNGRYKVYIIDEVHMMSKSAFNALLKTLEEPPPHAIFIFATTEPHKVLPTILSRVQRFDFRRIRVSEIVKHLRDVAEDEGISIDEESLHVIAKKADGALRDALGLMDQAIAFCGDSISHQDLLKALNVVGTDRLFELTQFVIDKDSAGGMKLLNDLVQEGHDLQEFLVSLTEHFRNLYIARSGSEQALIEASEDTQKQYREMAQHFHLQDIMRLLHVVSEGQLKIKDAHQPRVFCEITLLKLINMERVDGLTELLNELRELKKKLKNQPLSSLSDEKPSPETSEENKVEPKQAAQPKKDVEPVKQPVKPDEKIDSESTSSEETGNKSELESESVTEITEKEESQTPAPDNPKPRKKRSIKPPKGNSLIPEFKPAISTSSNNTNGASQETSPRNGQTDGSAASNNESSSEELQVSAEAVNEVENDDWVSEQTDASLADIKEKWGEFLKEVKKEVERNKEIENEKGLTQAGFLVLERLRPHSTKGNNVYLEVPDTFKQKIVETNRSVINKCFNAVLPYRVDVQSKLIEKEQTEETMDIYQRFKMLQEKDPKVRTIIELFGAELEF